MKTPTTFRDHYRSQLSQTMILPAVAADALMDEHILTPSSNMRGKTLRFGIAVRRLDVHAVVVLTELLKHEGMSITNFYNDLATRAYGCHPMLSDLDPANIAWCERYLDPAHWRRHSPADQYAGLDLVKMDWDNYQGYMYPVWAPLRPDSTGGNMACAQLQSELHALPTPSIQAPTARH